jgi:hypothetical protein
MRILFLCGCLQPAKDGVGDYVRSLAESCILQGNECQMIALNDRYVAQPVESADPVAGTKLVSLRLPATRPWPQRIKLAQAFQTQFQADWMSFQFVSYGLHDKGIVWNLCHHFQHLLTGFPVHIMFHELWIGMPPGAPFKHRVVGALQRLSVQRLCSMVKPRLVTTSNPLYIAALESIGVVSYLMPLFGNIPVVDRNLAQSLPLPLGEAGITPGNRSGWWLGLFFGGLYPEWKPEPFMSILRRAAQKAGKRICLLSLGRVGSSGENIWRQLQRDYPDIAFLTFGEQPPVMVSVLMQTADFGIAASPWQLIGKSGSAAAMLDHGLPVIVTREDAQSRFALTDPPSTDPLFHCCDEALESKLVDGLPKKSPYPRRDEIAGRFCSMLRENS